MLKSLLKVKAIKKRANNIFSAEILWVCGDLDFNYSFKLHI